MSPLGAFARDVYAAGRAAGFGPLETRRAVAGALIGLDGRNAFGTPAPAAARGERAYEAAAAAGAADVDCWGAFAGAVLLLEAGS
ncbi:MAG TPA: hypothetical protein VFS43_21655 [Polyangiaceae bacterium]|nr:hypothetical protein [Polyangiaceae bacterium]